VGLQFLQAGPGRVAVNLGAPIPLDRCHLFESGEISIDGVFRICRLVAVRGRDLTI
jgi:hypothetical protein